LLDDRPYAIEIAPGQNLESRRELHRRIEFFA